MGKNLKSLLVHLAKENCILPMVAERLRQKERESQIDWIVSRIFTVSVHEVCILGVRLF